MGDLSKTHQKNLQAKEKPNTDSIQSSVWLVMMHKCNTGIRSRIGK
jgi:2,3-bisphosphoglycerate-independent phosphoglycerate mutase